MFIYTICYQREQLHTYWWDILFLTFSNLNSFNKILKNWSSLNKIVSTIEQFQCYLLCCRVLISWRFKILRKPTDLIGFLYSYVPWAIIRPRKKNTASIKYKSFVNQDTCKKNYDQRYNKNIEQTLRGNIWPKKRRNFC